MISSSPKPPALSSRWTPPLIYFCYHSPGDSFSDDGSMITGLLSRPSRVSHELPSPTVVAQGKSALITGSLRQRWATGDGCCCRGAISRELGCFFFFASSRCRFRAQVNAARYFRRLSPMSEAGEAMWASAAASAYGVYTSFDDGGSLRDLLSAISFISSGGHRHSRHFRRFSRRHSSIQLVATR